jgi:hypothetical protein
MLMLEDVIPDYLIRALQFANGSRIAKDVAVAVAQAGWPGGCDRSNNSTRRQTGLRGG